MSMLLDEFLHTPRVAYFSMEIALRNEIPTYSGGLGVLAGDTLRSAADLELPMVAVSLISRAGYFRQSIDAQGRQTEQAATWEPAHWARPLDAKIAVPIEGRAVWIGAWLYLLRGYLNGVQPVLLLDTDLDENRGDDREITHYLYGGDEVYRLKQEIVLGIGGMRLLHALGFEIRQYHLNEGHSALLGLELMRRYTYPPENLRPGETPYDLPRVRELCNFTTHTPVEAGHDRFSYPLVERILGGVVETGDAPHRETAAATGDAGPRREEPRVDIAMLQHLAGGDRLNMTRLALNLSEYVNGVAQRHAEVSRDMFPGYRVHAITNGVHPFTWTSASFRLIYDQYVPSWCHEPELLRRADCCIPAAALWEAHEQARQALVDRVRARVGVALDPAAPILGYARRMTAYKRPDLLFSDLARLRDIAARYPFQVVLAGKAHPRDGDGKRLIEQLYAHARALEGHVAVAYLPDYDLDTALAMVSGVDVWLNTPLRPFEASGTSGMKAAFNGVPSLSVLDGWWVEGCIEGVTGWGIGDSGSSADGDARELYDKLERAVLPLYYADDRDAWIGVMKGAISKNAAYFNSHRMMRRYAAEAYIR